MATITLHNKEITWLKMLIEPKLRNPGPGGFREPLHSTTPGNQGLRTEKLTFKSFF
jgi:hypothetical protein